MFQKGIAEIKKKLCCIAGKHKWFRHPSTASMRQCRWCHQLQTLSHRWDDYGEIEDIWSVLSEHEQKRIQQSVIDRLHNAKV